MSCMVQTMGLPEARIFSIFLSESIPWFIQCRWMTSACWNSGSEVMSVPVLAMSTAKMFFLLKRLALQMTMRSQTNFHTMRQLWSSDTTEIWSVCLSRTSSLALMPWFLSDSIRRLAAMAAPPMRSDVLISSTLMTVVRFFFFECFFLLQMPVLFRPFPDTLLQRLPYDGEVAVP